MVSALLGAFKLAVRLSLMTGSLASSLLLWSLESGVRSVLANLIDVGLRVFHGFGHVYADTERSMVSAAQAQETEGSHVVLSL